MPDAYSRKQALLPQQRPNAVLLDILMRDYRNLVQECRGDGMTWHEIAKASKLPEWIVKCIAGEVAKNRPSVDRQSGR